jgi:FkbM family methyltransferase
MGSFTRDPFAALLHPHRLEVIFQVGARGGADTLDLRATYHPSIVHAFEPDPEARALARAALRGVPGIALHPFALWEKPGMIPLARARRARPAGAAAAAEGGDAADAAPQEATARAAILANVMAAEGVPRIDMLCLDAGAAALPVLRGAGPRLGDVRFVLAEAGAGPRRGLEEHLGSAGFVLRAEAAATEDGGGASAAVLYENPGFADAGGRAPLRHPRGFADAGGRAPLRHPRGGAGFLTRFEREWAPWLLHRAATFRQAFGLLVEAGKERPLLLEVGCLRKRDGDGTVHGLPVPSDHPWEPGGWHGPWSEGMSTLLFDRFAEACGGRVVSVDRDPVACVAARAATSDRTTTVIEADSLAVLGGAAGEVLGDVAAVDLLYLDSFGPDWDAPEAHHARELEAIYPRLPSGCLILVDDCRDLGTGREGPGSLVVGALLRARGLTPLAEGSQELWRKP